MALFIKVRRRLGSATNGLQNRKIESKLLTAKYLEFSFDVLQGKISRYNYLNLLDPSFQPPIASNVFRSLLYVFKAANFPYPPKSKFEMQLIIWTKTGRLFDLLFLWNFYYVCITFFKILIFVKRLNGVILSKSSKGVY